LVWWDSKNHFPHKSGSHSWATVAAKMTLMAFLFKSDDCFGLDCKYIIFFELTQYWSINQSILFF